MKTRQIIFKLLFFTVYLRSLYARLPYSLFFNFTLAEKTQISQVDELALQLATAAPPTQPVHVYLSLASVLQLCRTSVLCVFFVRPIPSNNPPPR